MTRFTHKTLPYLACFFVCLMSTFMAAAADAPPLTQPGGTIILNAPNAIRSMDPSNTTYSGIAVTGGTISALSSQPIVSSQAINLPAGAAVYPGFIDSHSHAISLFTALTKSKKTGKPYWISLANVNVMMLPDCGLPLPAGAPCYSPVKTQEQVISLLSGNVANSAGLVLGWNYEPTRLTCPDKEGGLAYGFACPNFENQLKTGTTALAVLHKLQPKVPTIVTSESGHIVYVNPAALAWLNICGTTGSTPAGCYMPTINPALETSLANAGQLDEDLALYAIGKAEAAIAADYGPTFSEDQIRESLALYSKLGYTTVQEGAASSSLIQSYMNVATTLAGKGKYLPATMAFLAYDDTTPANFAPSAKNASSLQAQLTAGQYDMFIAGMKVYSDGSIQGYTGDMMTPVQYINPPTQFGQGYDGLPDYTGPDVAGSAQAAHANNFPLWVHTNGNQAHTNVVGALAANKSPKLRDVIVHFAMPTAQQVKTVSENNIGVTFLANDTYYFFQSVCEQILGSQSSANLYPAGWTQGADVPYGLHSDVTVTPPSPMFGVWVASTRNFQQLGSAAPSAACTNVAKTQAITRQQALQAYTSNAAWLYNREKSIGSLQKEYAGDLVVLSQDPMNPNVDLSKICVLYTIHNGNKVYEAPGAATGKCTPPPVWPIK